MMIMSAAVRAKQGKKSFKELPFRLEQTTRPSRIFLKNHAKCFDIFKWVSRRMAGKSGLGIRRGDLRACNLFYFFIKVACDPDKANLLDSHI